MLPVKEIIQESLNIINKLLYKGEQILVEEYISIYQSVEPYTPSVGSHLEYHLFFLQIG